MPRVALSFFTLAPIYLLIGMVWGSIMGATEDHSLSPAHGHLNLLGFVLNAVMGTFYALTAGRTSPRLAWANFGLSNLGVILMIPTLVIILKGDLSVIPVMMAAEAATILGVLCFFASVLSVWRKPAA